MSVDDEKNARAYGLAYYLKASGMKVWYTGRSGQAMDVDNGNLTVAGGMTLARHRTTDGYVSNGVDGTLTLASLASYAAANGEDVYLFQRELIPSGQVAGLTQQVRLNGSHLTVARGRTTGQFEFNGTGFTTEGQYDYGGGAVGSQAVVSIHIPANSLAGITVKVNNVACGQTQGAVGSLDTAAGNVLDVIYQATMQIELFEFCLAVGTPPSDFHALVNDAYAGTDFSAPGSAHMACAENSDAADEATRTTWDWALVVAPSANWSGFFDQTGNGRHSALGRTAMAPAFALAYNESLAAPVDMVNVLLVEFDAVAVNQPVTLLASVEIQTAATAAGVVGLSSSVSPFAHQGIRLAATTRAPTFVTKSDALAVRTHATTLAAPAAGGVRHYAMTSPGNTGSIFAYDDTGASDSDAVTAGTYTTDRAHVGYVDADPGQSGINGFFGRFAVKPALEITDTLTNLAGSTGERPPCHGVSGIASRRMGLSMGLPLS